MKYTSTLIAVSDIEKSRQFYHNVLGMNVVADFGANVTLDGVTVHSMIENKAGMNLPTLYASMAVGLLFCAAEAVLCKFAEIYFKNELADGNPFTLRGAKELMRLGVLTIAIPLGTVIVCSIGVAIADNVYPGIDKLSIGEFSSVGLGVMMIVLSLFCRYGAELNEGKLDACHE